MKTNRCDISRSLLEYLQNESTYKKGACYVNTTVLLPKYIRDASARCVIGYVLSTDGAKKIAVRHCWLKTIDAHTKQPVIIDVTMFADDYHPANVVNFEYLTVQEYNLKNWMQYTVEHDGIPYRNDCKTEPEIVKRLKAEGYEILD